MTKESVSKVLYKVSKEIIDYIEVTASYENPEAELEKIADEIPKIFCRWTGHYPIADQCGRPEHDYCVRCREATPNMAATFQAPTE